MNLTFNNIRATMTQKGYAFFTEGDYNLNIIGVRSRDLQSNGFNDAICLLFYTSGSQHLFVLDATTDPGNYWRNHLANVLGTAIMVPGQYRGLWMIGMHQGKYVALVQKGPVKLYRDSNRDLIINCDNPVMDAGNSGINGHRASATVKSVQVDQWSAGCQVVADPLDFDVMMALCSKARALHGNSFTYTLLLEEDIAQ